MVKRANLDLWYRYPANVTGKELLAEALRRGWQQAGGKGDHVRLTHPAYAGHLVIDLGTKADGTKRQIIRTLQEVEDAD